MKQVANTDSFNQQITPKSKAHNTLQNSIENDNSLQKIINDPDGLNEDLNFSVANIKSLKTSKNWSTRIRRNSKMDNSGE